MKKRLKNSGNIAKIQSIDPATPQAGTIRQAADVLARNGLLVFPTTGLYGLGADALSVEAIERVPAGSRLLVLAPMVSHRKGTHQNVLEEIGRAGFVRARVNGKVLDLGEDEIEQIIEKVVTKVVEKLAGSILERVAWEVVPDLAENLIREEIRKIKDTAA